MTRFSGNRFLGLSWSGKAPAAVERARALTKGWAVGEAAGAILACERADCFAETGASAVALGVRRLADRSTASAVDAPVVAASSDFASFARRIAPPLQLGWLRDGALGAATDAFGIGQIFVAERDGMTAFSTSATLLADLFDAPLDPAALTAFALFGAFPEDQCPFEGVRKLPAGATLTLAGGRCAVAQAPSSEPGGRSLDDSLIAAVGALHGAFSDADLELSGGLDSRLILAALPRDARRGHRAVTIGAAGSGDVEVARRIAAAEGLRHELIDISGVAALDAEALHALLADAVVAYDHSANPIDKAPLAYAGRFIDSPARFGGQNGEIARGFFYPAQPLDAEPGEALARRLIRMRLEANDRVDPALFAPAAHAELAAQAEERMAARIVSFGGSWSQTLDRLYLAERMQRWTGNATANLLTDRTSLYPFFDPSVVAAAMALPARAKANSRAAYALLARLDPALAAMPLDNGRVPAAPGGSLIADARLAAGRVTARIRRRLLGEDNRGLGSRQIIELWHRHRLFERLPVDALARTGVFDPAALNRLHMGSWLPDRATLGFVLMMAGLVERSR